MRVPRAPSPAGAEPVRHLLDAARADLRAVPDFGRAREQELVELVLSRTTRSRPVRGRWRSASISLAAAVLLTSSAALLYSARAAHAPALVLAELASPVVAPLLIAKESRAAGAPRDVLALARDELVTAASAARQTRTGVEAGGVEENVDAPLEVRLLEARAKGLRERRWEPWLREIPLSDLGTLSLALWCEVQLDRYLLDGARPPAWKRAVEILQRDLARPEIPRESSKLLAHALERARDYGLTEDVEVARLDPARPPWTGQWFDDLDAAGREAGVADSGMWRAWVDWRGQ